MPHLDVITGSAMGSGYPLKKSQYVLGRHLDCDIVLESGSVSRQHARISKSGNNFVLEDLNSRNGSFVNRRLIGEPTTLVEGDTIRICGESGGTSKRPAMKLSIESQSSSWAALKKTTCVL